MVAVVDIWVAAEDWWMVAMMGEMRVVAAIQICKELETLKELDATTSTRHDDAATNSTMQKLKRKDAKARIVSGKRSNPNIFGFFVDCRKNRCNLH